VFLSLLSSLAEGPTTDSVLLQDPHPFKVFVPCFSGFKSFAPPFARPRVACYVSHKSLQRFALLPSFPPETGLHGVSGLHSTRLLRHDFRSLHDRQHLRRTTPFISSFSPPQVVPFGPCTTLTGRRRLHPPQAATNPSRLLSAKEKRQSAPYFH